MKIGVLALQGDFFEHLAILSRLGVEGVEVRLPDQLEDLSGLIIPGGESTTIGKMAEDFGLIEPLRQFGKDRAIWGTCAGAIFLAKDIHRPQPLLKLMDMVVDRNAFGRQLESFEIDLFIPALSRIDPENKPYHAVFIRAPIIKAVHGTAEVLARLDDGRIVGALQGHLMATSFHPELTSDTRLHQLFLSITQSQKS